MSLKLLAVAGLIPALTFPAFNTPSTPSELQAPTSPTSSTSSTSALTFDRVVVSEPRPPQELQLSSERNATVEATGNQYDAFRSARRGGGSCVAPGGFTQTCQDGTGYVVRKSATSQMNLGYAWSVSWFSSSNANVKGRGYSFGREVWRGGGNSKSGSFTVPWHGYNGGEVMSVKKVQVRSMNPPAGVTVNWN